MLGGTTSVIALPTPAAKPDSTTAPAQPAPPVPSDAASAPSVARGTVPLPATLTPDRQVLLRQQVALDRAGFSPGVIDAADGSNFQNALTAYRAAHAGAELVAADAPLPLARYTIRPDDVAGPFAPVPKNLAKMAEMKTVGYTNPVEGLAELFHADEAFLRELNPGADFAKAGTVILVPDVIAPTLPKVARIEIDKTRQQLRAFGADGAVVAIYPATVGSTDRPAPSGRYKVVTWAPHATYTYDPKRLTFGKKSHGKLTIPAGPNNPVGGMWIALNKPTYGIHGTPEPRLVGKRASHGCVRLTNWDAAALGAAVERGTSVVFVGTEQRKG